MSITQKITGADWSTWMRHLAAACIKGAALGVKASGCLGFTAAASTGTSNPVYIDLHGMLVVAASGFIYAAVDYLANTSLPTGSEVLEPEETPAQPTSTPASTPTV